MSRGSCALGLGLLLIGGGSTKGCTRFELTRGFQLDHPPPGFVTKDRTRHQLRLSGPTGIEVEITASEQWPGTTLAYVADFHISTQRSALGLQLYAQTPVTSTNGIQGTRFDLHDLSGEPSIVIIIFFVTDTRRVSIMLRGPVDQLAALDEASDWILAELEVPGCNRRYRSVCEGPQPPPFRLDPGPDYVEPSDARLCAHVADILRSTRSSDRRTESPEFTRECEASFAERRAEFGAEAIDELTRCVISADSFTALLRCNADLDRSAAPCRRVEKLDEEGNRYECGDDFRTLQIERGPLAADEIATCVLAATSAEQLERCKH